MGGRRVFDETQAKNSDHSCSRNVRPCTGLHRRVVLVYSSIGELKAKEQTLIRQAAKSTGDRLLSLFRRDVKDGKEVKTGTSWLKSADKTQIRSILNDSAARTFSFPEAEVYIVDPNRVVLVKRPENGKPDWADSI